MTSIIYPDDIVGELKIRCKCGKIVTLIRNGKETNEEERICCGYKIDFLHLAVIKK